MADLRFYRAQERAFCDGIVKDWPKVWRMPRKVPHGRLVAVTVDEVIAELREHGYRVEPPSTNAVDPSAQPSGTPTPRDPNSLSASEVGGLAPEDVCR